MNIFSILISYLYWWPWINIWWIRPFLLYETRWIHYKVRSETYLEPSRTTKMEFLQIQQTVNYFRKKLHLRYLTGFWIRLWRSPTNLVQGSLYNGLTFCIQRWRCFIKQQYFRITHQCTSNRNSLLLPTTKLCTSFTHERVKTLRQKMIRIRRTSQLLRANFWFHPFKFQINEGIE